MNLEYSWHFGYTRSLYITHSRYSLVTIEQLLM